MVTRSELYRKDTVFVGIFVLTISTPGNSLSAPFDSYNLNFPFFNDPNAPLWHAAIGYEISSILGILLIGGATYGLGYLLSRRGRGPNVSADSERSSQTEGSAS